MNAQIYNDIIGMMPKQLRVDVGPAIIPITQMVGNEPLGVCFNMTAALMQEDTAGMNLVEWASQQFPKPLKYNSDDGQQFVNTANLVAGVLEKFKNYKLYFQGIMPYQCEEVLDDGSLLLERVDDFDRFCRLSVLFRPLQGCE